MMAKFGVGPHILQRTPLSPSYLWLLHRGIIMSTRHVNVRRRILLQGAHERARLRVVRGGFPEQDVLGLDILPVDLRIGTVIDADDRAIQRNARKKPFAPG